jgi:tripartite-type tricarboxylate transporter receptor subunit TctC
MRSNLTSRRTVMKLGAAAALTAVPLLSRATGWPQGPIRLVVPSAAGGSPDAICRLLGAELSKSLHQRVSIDNIPGAAGNLGMQDLVRATPDGCTVGYGNVGTLVINKYLFKNLPYDPSTQLVPVALLGYVQNALVVRNDLGVDSVQALIALTKSMPGKLKLGSAGMGTTGHLGAELFKNLTGTQMSPAFYSGSVPAITDMLDGKIDVMFDNLSSISPYTKSGRLKLLAVTGARRSGLFPDTVTVAECGVKGFDVVAWGGIVAPAGTPRAIVTELNAAINQVLATPAVGARYAALGFEILICPPDRLAERAVREAPIWADVVKRSGAHME